MQASGKGYRNTKNTGVPLSSAVSGRTQSTLTWSPGHLFFQTQKDDDAEAHWCRPGLLGYGRPPAEQGWVGLDGQAGGPGKSAGCMGSELLRHPEGAVACTRLWFFSAQTFCVSRWTYFVSKKPWRAKPQMEV